MKKAKLCPEKCKNGVRSQKEPGIGSNMELQDNNNTW
jgi:hypothetical protein